MRRLKLGIIAFAAAALLTSVLLAIATPAFADCRVISATHGGHWQGEALNKAQALDARKAQELKIERGWRSVTMKAQPVKPDPFWKTVRRDVSENVVVGTFVTARTHTTCFTGVIVPFVCTAGSQICGN